MDDAQYLADNRLSSQSFNSSHFHHRPRGSSWSQCTRPHTDPKTKSKRSHRPHPKSPQSTTPSDYIDMTCGSKGDSCYVEMSLNHKNCKTVTLQSPSAEDKENHIPSSRSPRISSKSRVISEPFPELSASSEDDVSLHSMEGSTSLYSLTSSGDSVMSVSSHSPYHSSHANPSPTLQMESEQLSVMRSSVRVSQRSLQAPSFIRDDTHSDYMEMSSAASNK